MTVPPTYKQIHGCAIGSPVSHNVAKKWFRFVDVFAIIKKHALTNVFNLLNSVDPHIYFIIKYTNLMENFHF